MSGSPDTLVFRFPAHADSILSKLNTLREEQCFCDITLRLKSPPGTAAQTLHFHGHRVVLAASSDFLRDQFLLHKGQAELTLGVVSYVEVGRSLLLSCYTGLLEVPLRELVSYLTAASALQMTQVAEKCAQAISKYLSPTLNFLKLDGNTDHKDFYQNCRSQLGSSSKDKGEREGAQPGTRNQEVNTEECKAAGIQSKAINSQGCEVETEEKDGKVASDKKELTKGISWCPESQKKKEIAPDGTNKPLYPGDQRAGGEGCSTDNMSPETRGSPAPLEENSGKQCGEQEQEQTEEMFLIAQQQDCSNLTDSDQTEDSDSRLVHRPHLCRRCDRVFQHLESYVGHLKEHRQHLCLVCGKGFSQKSILTQHVLIHSGVKPFRCPLCHDTFSQKTTLQDHFNLHTGNKAHKCHYCAVQFAHKLGLKRHLKGFHGKCCLQNVQEEAVE